MTLADEAWAEYARTHPENGGLPNRAAYITGYRQALLDAAKEIYNGAPDPCQAFYNYGLHPWLIDRVTK